jgi:hypothetical protein
MTSANAPLTMKETVIVWANNGTDDWMSPATTGRSGDSAAWLVRPTKDDSPSVNTMSVFRTVARP